MASASSAATDFAQYCCELLVPIGPCVARRMFGGFGISTGGLTLALVADLGQGLQLWLKADDVSRAQFEGAGCTRFIYQAAGVAKSMNYYSAPDAAMESPDAMRPWARLALDSALKARMASAKSTRVATKKVAKFPPRKDQPPASRASASAARPQTRRKPPPG